MACQTCFEITTTLSAIVKTAGICEEPFGYWSGSRKGGIPPHTGVGYNMDRDFPLLNPLQVVCCVQPLRKI